MEKRTSRASAFAAGVLVAVNACAMLYCLMLFALGLWIISSPASLSYAVEATQSPAVKALLAPETLSVQAGVGLVALAMLLFFVCYMGFYGALSRSQFLLFMYSTLVFLLLLLECALLFYFSSNLIEKGAPDRDEQWSHATRLAFSCCEHNSSSAQSGKRPWSCCGAAAPPDNCTAELAHRQECRASITEWLDRYQTPVYVCIAALHVALSACALVRRSCGARAHA